MKLPFIIYAQGLGLYLLLSLPAAFVPGVYFQSAGYAIGAGFAAMALFCAVFFVLHVTRASLNVAFAVLFISIPVAVAVAYKLLLLVEMPGRSFWLIDEFTMFPVAAIISGWVALAVNNRKITGYFTPPVYDNAEIIFS